MCVCGAIIPSNIKTLKGKATLFEKSHFSLSHGQNLSKSKRKKIRASQKNSNLGQKALKSAKIRAKWHFFLGQ